MLVKLFDDLVVLELLCLILVYDGSDVFLHGGKLSLQRRVMLLEELHGRISVDSLRLALGSDPLTQQSLLNLGPILGEQFFPCILLLL